jgi:hypothetical protein
MDDLDSSEEKKRVAERRDESEDRRSGDRRGGDRRAADRREVSRRKESCPTCGDELTPTQYCVRCKIKVVIIRQT